MKASPLQLHDIKDGLNTKRLGTQFHWFHEIDSTNSYARRLAEQGAPDGEVVIAEQQTQGRGRLAEAGFLPLTSTSIFL